MAAWMSDCLHGGWGEDLCIKGSLSDLYKYTALYRHGHNRFDVPSAGLFGAAGCNGRSCGWQKVQ